MDEPTPDTPERRGAEMAADSPPRPTDETANPHRAEPAPPPQEGLRPEADPALVHPDEEERLGPAQGLFHTAAAEAAHEAPVETPGADAETAYLGIEEEGVESSQIFGLMLATVAVIACLVLALYFLFYLPHLQGTELGAEDVPADRRVEQRELRAAAENLLGQYAVNADAEGRYRIPIAAAMQGVARDYGAAADSGLVGPVTRADYNLSWITLEPAPAVLAPAAPGEIALPEQPLPGVEASVAAPAVEEGAEPAPSIPTGE